jgi:lipid II:glycine glycyltransferase (peptidoglycan interpeptide bridge formation enzyme)
MDIYYSYEYGYLFAQIEKGNIFAAYYEKNETKLFYPFIKRSVPYPHYECFDIVTPYGYGGPFLEGEDQTIIHDFYNEFFYYCLEEKILTETIRCHPLLKNYHYLAKVMDIQYIRQTTGVNLLKPMDIIRAEYTTNNKRNIRKAQREGVYCFQAAPTYENISIFMDLYKETMNRNHASDYYYFSEDYFLKQMEETSLSKSYLLFAAYKGEVIAGVIVIIGKEYAHYHLGASKTAFLFLKPNNLLFDYMVEFSERKGASLLHLGGGYEEDDGLFRFKTSFTNNNHFSYYIGKKVYNPSLYHKIISEIRKRYEVNESYFPLYRGMIAPKKWEQKM